ncbi:dihydroneopterin aldolase [Pseudoxanthomonas sangjuensis]|uniref:dihydroneopterin aldolase n=1 Tax=Pseudoxanthomonas sangjuensis TaxID=1503750 RepID=UPI00139192CA|nr:dihydroneopterin aldolase [Pseudoxanthomonas sangjuensis]KAF1711897.1 dihydroneopterin aldolase [Pseudoxanthomonas sangjuensis]
MDIVFIEALEADALIGVYDWERTAPQKLLFDVEMGFDNRGPGASDALADTIDYAQVAETIVAICRDSKFQLVEALAERIAGELLRRFPVATLSLRVSKPGAVPAARGVGVRIVRERPRA